MASSSSIGEVDLTEPLSSPGSDVDPDKEFKILPVKQENSAGSSPQFVIKTQNNSLTPGQIIAERLEREIEARRNGLPVPNDDFCIDYVKSDCDGITPDQSEGSSFNYHGDTLSPGHPRNFPVAPVIENGREIFYCHLCSYSGPSRAEFTDHLDGHFEHRSEKCDYTSRTEGRLKQHLQNYHLRQENIDSNDEAIVDLADAALEDNSTAPQKQSGRPKIYRCKHCDFSATIKEDFWKHARIHIKEDKLLQCPKCEFITEYKHHLEYHVRNHFGSKPFKCNKCTYACVNKSMLNSHMKSHTNIYQYRCADCNYATKYCHSLKLHLRKYNHKPASIINLDGTVDHDTSSLLTMKRSGPAKTNPPRSKQDQQPNPPTSIMPYLSNQTTPNMLPIWSFSNGMRPTPPLMPANLSNFFRRMLPLPHLMKPMVPTSNDGQNRPAFKCKICNTDYQTKDLLAHHTLMEHPASNPDFLSELGLMNGAKSEINPQPTPTTLSTPVLPTPALNTPFPSTSPMFNYAPSNAFNGRPSSNTRSESCKTPSMPSISPISAPPMPRPSSTVDRPLDLTKNDNEQAESVISNSSEQSSTPIMNALLESSRKRSRKGKAFKLDALCLKLQEKVDFDKRDEDDVVFDSPDTEGVPVKRRKSITEMERAPTASSQSSENNNNNNNNMSDVNHKDVKRSEDVKSVPANGDFTIGRNEQFSCPYCDISFMNCVMYTMHMGYHGYQNPFKCNMCGEESLDKVSFFLHIARAAHN